MYSSCKLALRNDHNLVRHAPEQETTLTDQTNKLVGEEIISKEQYQPQDYKVISSTMHGYMWIHGYMTVVLLLEIISLPSGLA